MRAFLKEWAVAIPLVCAFLSGYGRGSDGTAGADNKKGDAMHIEPGVASEESEQWGHLPLQIAAVYKNQKALDKPPWHATGGDWTFLECELSKASPARVLVGTRTISSPKGDMPYALGEALLAVSDTSAATGFVEAFAKAFHQPVPARHGEKPPGFLRVITVVIGDGLVRDSTGAFENGRGGGWTVTRWFWGEGEARAEVFFNYSAVDRRAEFAKTYEGDRGVLIEQLVVALRDGPLPERTPENDPGLTLIGPKIVGWTRVASSNETCRFTPDGRGIVITASEKGVDSKLFAASLASPSDRRLLAGFERFVSVLDFIATNQGLRLLVTETVRRNPDVISPDDPQILWVVEPQGKREVPGPPGVKRWFTLERCVSPDKRFVALHSWQRKPGVKNNTRVIHLGALQSGGWRTIELPETSLELVGWTGGKIAGVVLTGTGFERNEVRKAYLLDPDTAVLSPLEEIPVEFAPGRKLSPDRQRAIEVVWKERLIITDLASGRKRDFAFHPCDRRVAHRDSVQWANDRYLVFNGARTALIDVDALKMSFPTDKDSGIVSVEFSPDFKSALGMKADGYYLGRIEMPAP
jgi:hypothetical protein